MSEETPSVGRQWEKRAAEHLKDCRGVLYGNLPAAVNEAIDHWHAALVEQHILPDLPENGAVLDLAAGYGRLSRVIRSHRPDAQLVGIDLSPTYSRLYTDEIGNGVCADMRALPFAEQCFDRVVAVTGLMYLEATECEVCVGRIMACLKPGGLALFVDPGAEMIRLLRSVSVGSARGGTGGEGFFARQYLDLFGAGGGRVVARGGNLTFTALLPLLLLIRQRRLVAWLAALLVRADLRIGGWNRFALHRWMLVRREA